MWGGGGRGTRFTLGLQKLFNFNNVLWQSHCLAFLVLPYAPSRPYSPICVSVPAGLTLPYSQLFLPRLSVYFLSRIVILLFSFYNHQRDRFGSGDYSPHSFRRGVASFVFKCNVPSQLIHRQGDWQSDAYLTYLNMSQEQKQLAVTTMADDILRLSSVWHFVVNSYLTMAS